MIGNDDYTKGDYPEREIIKVMIIFAIWSGSFCMIGLGACVVYILVGQ